MTVTEIVLVACRRLKFGNPSLRSFLIVYMKNVRSGEGRT